MKKFLALAVLVVGVASAQVVPFGLNMEHGTKVLAFVAADCPACEALREELAELPILYVGTEANLPYEPYYQDSRHQLMFRAFRLLGVQSIPAVFVLKEGQVVAAHMQDIDAEAVRIAVQEAEQGVLVPHHTYNLAVGEVVGGEFAAYTGLVVFWRESCPACEELKPVVVDICQSRPLSIMVLSTREEPLPEACPGKYAREVALDWGIPGVPSLVYLKDGRVMWIDLGYREDFKEMVEALVETEGR